MIKLLISKDDARIKIANKNVDLSKLEFGVLYYLARNNKRIVSRTELYKDVWKTKVSERSADVVISKIRTKLDFDKVIVSKPDGYIISDDIDLEIINDTSLTIKDKGNIIHLKPMHQKSNGVLITIIAVANSEFGTLIIYSNNNQVYAETVDKFKKSYKELIEK